MRLIKIISYNFVFFIILILICEALLGYWFSENNFGIYMRKERRINWQTKANFYGNEHNFFYKRNFWGFRGDEFDPKDVKIIFEGGSTGNQRFTPENLTIVELLNKNFNKSDYDIKIYNSSTDGKSLNGYINDFNFWFSKIPNLNPRYVIFYLGINDRFNNFKSKYYLDNKVSEKKIDQIKDYIKNNSFIVDKYKIFKNRYFPKNTFAYDLSNDKLYENFEYVDFQDALKLHTNIDETNLHLIKNFRIKLNILKLKIDELNIQPVFISQLMHDGLKDERLFLINNELKNFASTNNYFIIPLDEILSFERNDFFDTVHTTPQGSKKIADKIFPILLDIIKENNEIRK